MSSDFINQYFNEVLSELPLQGLGIPFDYGQLLKSNNFTGGNWWPSSVNYQFLSGSHLSSMFLHPDSIDEIDEEFPSVIPDIDFSSGGQPLLNNASESTESENINYRNKEFLSLLNDRSKSFIISLRHADFEDGMENDVIKEVEGYLEQNEHPTLLWMFSIYSNNQKDADVLSGLLRIIGMTVGSDDADLMLPMIKAGLADPNSKTQEAALMVIEQWRTKNCLDALETAPNFSSEWIGKYAERVKSELKEELRNDVASNGQWN